MDLKTKKENIVDSLVSIIMPAYNVSNYIEGAINSVISQTYKNWELIIVDDCSTDDTVNKIKKIRNDKIRFYSLSTNLGRPSKVRNFALKKAKGDFIAFLDADDMWERIKIDKQIAFMKDNCLALSYSSVKHINEENKIIHQRLIVENKDVLFENLLKNYDITTTSVILNRSLISDCEIIFNDILTIGEDYELFMKIAFSNRIGSTSKFLSFWRNHGNSISHKMELLAAVDMKTVYINLKKIDIYNNYTDSFLYLESKIAYYEVKELVRNNNYGKARNILSKLKFVDKRIFLLWGLLFFGRYGWVFSHYLKNKFGLK